MRTLLELQEAREDLVKTSRDVIENAKKDDERALTSEEKTELAACQRDIGVVDADIAERNIFDRYDQVTTAQMDSLAATTRKVPAGEPNNGGGPPERATWNVPSHHQRFGKLKAFKGAHADSNAYRSGQFIRAALFQDPRADRWCKNNGLDVRALSIGVNTAGGFTVPEEMATAIIDLREEYGVFRRECDVMPMARDIMTIPRSSGSGTAAFVNENTALTASEVTFNQVTLTAHKLGRICLMSTEIADDAIINMADWLAEHFAYSFALKEDETGFTGDGTASYASIRGVNVKIIDGNHAAGVVDAESGDDQFAELTLVALTNLMGACPAYAHNGAKWFCSQLAHDTVFGRLAAAAGGNTIQTMAGAFAPSFLGYPIVISQIMPKVTTALNNLVMLLFGNLKMAATLGDRREFTIATSSDRYFEIDQIAIKATERIDINVHDLGDGTTAGPIVALIGNT